MAFKKGEKPPNPKPFKKGQSGNPAGRPRKLPEIRQIIDEVLGEEKDGMTAAEAIFKKWRQMAMQGNIKAAELLIAYAYGKPIQRSEVDHTTGGEKFNGFAFLSPIAAPDDSDNSDT